MNNSYSFPCHLYMLYLNEKGEIFPCPRTPINNLIGHVYDSNILQRIIDYVPQKCECTICALREATQEEKLNGIVNLNLEIGGECNGACFFCFQKTLSTFRKHYPYYQALETFFGGLSHLKTATIFGGEVTVQAETLRLISLLNNMNGAKVTIVTNGDIQGGQYESLCKIIDNFQVSFYGFSTESVQLISMLDLNHVLAFCEYVSNNNRQLDVKFVLSPLVVHELLPFLEWSLSLNVQHVMLYYAILPTEDYESTGRRDVSSFENLNPEYWEPVLTRLSIAVRKFFSVNNMRIKEKNINYIINHDVLRLLKIPRSFLNELGIPQKKSISISCKAWTDILGQKKRGDKYCAV